MKASTLCLFFITLSFACPAQEEPEILAVFKVEEAWNDTKNVSSLLRRMKAYTMFYRMEKSDTVEFMANVWPKSFSQSFGPMVNVKRRKIPAANGLPETEFLNFEWHYLNSYDLKQGIAMVSVEIVHQPSGNFYTVRILPEDMELIIYKGQQEK